MGQTDVITRLPDWERRLIDFIQGELGKPYECGKTDCCTLMVGALTAMCGRFPQHSYTYTTLDEARAILKTFDFFPWLAGHFAIERVRPKFQQRGDLIFIAWDDLFCSHVVLGADIVSVDPERGVFKAKLATLPQEHLIEIIRIL